MPDQVFGLSANEIMAYAAVANLALVIVLAGITAYYAWHARRQADASREQVIASYQQSDIAQKTLDLLLKQKEQQRRIDISTVMFQLEAAIHMIDEWQTRIATNSYPHLPDVIEIRPTNFDGSIPNADRIDQIVAGYMGAGLLYIAEAETNIRVMRGVNPTQPRGWQQPQEKAAHYLSVARFKLDSARTRMRTLMEAEGTACDVETD